MDDEPHYCDRCENEFTIRGDLEPTRYCNECAQSLAETLLEALVKLWKHTPKIDNGRCMVCRIGYASWIPDGKGDLKVGPCDRDDCLSHVVTKAIRETGAGK